jgi:hypothetical protein
VAAQQPAQQRRGRGGAESGQRGSSTGAEVRRPLCRWSRGGATVSDVGACSGHGSATAGGDPKAETGDDLKVGTGGDLMGGVNDGM